MSNFKNIKNLHHCILKFVVHALIFEILNRQYLLKKYFERLIEKSCNRSRFRNWSVNTMLGVFS